MIHNLTSGGGGSGGTLTVTAPAGVTVTISKDGKVKTKTADSSGVAIFKGLSSGTWTVTISDGVLTRTETIDLIADYAKTMSFVKIYGIYRDITNSSPEWAREEDAVGKTATATIGTVAGSSDFDDCYPWSEITRETLSTGDVMVKIPKFWYRRYREGNVEHIQIADMPVEGFSLHPAFSHAGVEQDCVYVGAYTTSANSMSEAGVSPKASILRSTSRSNAQAKGAGWGILDISTLSAIQMLYLVEFANYNTQATIGRGCSDSVGSFTKTGTCDGVSGRTGRPSGTDGKVDVVWRGLEGLWGNAWEHVDGVNFYGNTYYICNDPSAYADGTSDNYTPLAYTADSANDDTYITLHGLDDGCDHIMLPLESGGSETTYLCDIILRVTKDTAWHVTKYGGYYNRKSDNGLFAISIADTTTKVNDVTGARLLYIPQ